MEIFFDNFPNALKTDFQSKSFLAKKLAESASTNAGPIIGYKSYNKVIQ